jgi:hypothetical protein
MARQTARTGNYKRLQNFCPQTFTEETTLPMEASKKYDIAMGLREIRVSVEWIQLAQQ